MAVNQGGSEVINILQLGKFYPPHWGGIETVTYNLNEILDGDDYKVTNYVYGKKSKSDNNNIKRFSYLQLFRTPISFSLLFGLFFTKKNFEHVIVHLPNPWAVFCLLLSGYRGSIIVYWHAESKGPKLLMSLVSFFEAMLFKKSRVIWGATNEHTKNIPNYETLKDKCHILSYPVSQNLVEKSKEITKKKFLDSGKVKIINVGRLVEYKGQIYLLKAIKELDKRGVDVHLTIVGDGALFSELNAYIMKNNLDDKVSVCPNLSNSELNKVFSESDIFCFPSITDQEMYGMAQIEAYANGLPAIVSDIPNSGVPEVALASGAAELVPPFDDIAIADKIQSYISNDNVMQNYSEQARNYIQSFSRDYKLNEIKKYFII